MTTRIKMRVRTMRRPSMKKKMRTNTRARTRRKMSTLSVAGLG